VKFIPLKTAALIVFLAVLAGILYYIALLPQKPKVNENASEVKTAATTLSVENTKRATDGKYYSNVLINTNGNSVTSLQLEFSFDNNFLESVEIKNGTFFKEAVDIVKKIDQENGRITYAFGVSAGQDGASGKGVIATIYYSPIDPAKETITAIKFLPKTEVSAWDFSGSALSGTFDGIVSISAATPTKAPTPTFVPFTPTPTPEGFVPPPGFTQ